MKYPTIALVSVIVMISFYFFSFIGQSSDEDEVSVEQVIQMITEKDSIILLDVRTVLEFDGSLGHIPGAILIPLSELESRMDELEGYKDAEVIVICRSGNRSGRATRFLRDNGIKAYNMRGGMLDWNKMLTITKNDSTGEINETISE